MAYQQVKVDQQLPRGALAVAWFGREYGKVRVIKNNSKERLPVPVYEPDSDSDSEEEVDFLDTDDDPASDEELFMYAQYGKPEAPTQKSESLRASGLCYYVQTLGPQEVFRWVPAAALRPAARCQLYRPGFQGAPGIVYYTTPTGQQKSWELSALLPFKVGSPSGSTGSGTALRCYNNKRKHERSPVSCLVLENRKRELYENFHKALEKDVNVLNSRATLAGLLADCREKHELVVEDVMSAADVDNYVDRWKKQVSSNCKAAAACTQRCLVCAMAAGRLRACPRCAAVYHLPCRKNWLIHIIHPRESRGDDGPPAPAPALVVGPAPRELRDVLACPACVWDHRPSEKRWYLRLWPTPDRQLGLHAPPAKRPNLALHV